MKAVELQPVLLFQIFKVRFFDDKSYGCPQNPDCLEHRFKVAG